MGFNIHSTSNYNFQPLSSKTYDVFLRCVSSEIYVGYVQSSEQKNNTSTKNTVKLAQISDLR